mmetsp:Transcript_23570/g.53504  ORF Transcript_23570/g.53504 Transcript_23570/m.53504 type:complete len:370 (+) Transcript_23570:1-1110(+)
MRGKTVTAFSVVGTGDAMKQTKAWATACTIVIGALLFILGAPPSPEPSLRHRRRRRRLSVFPLLPDPQSVVSKESSLPPRLPSDDVRPFVAIVACIAGVDGIDRFIEEHLLSSIYDTVTPEERRDYRVELILGYDDTDEFWQSHTRELRPRRKHGESGDYAGHEVIPLNFVSIRKDPDGKRPNRIPFNELLQAAREYGATYITRINDDTEFLTSGWITVATKALGSLFPPNVGVVGPFCKQGNVRIMTHDFVHASTHLSIFGTYYPEVFDNWFLDDWITRVYGRPRTRMLADFEVEHHFKSFGTRYKWSWADKWKLDQEVVKGGEAIDRYMREKKPVEQRKVLGTDTVEKVDGSGQMGQLHFELKNMGT